MQTTPLLTDLRRANPEAAIDVLAWTEFAPVVDGLQGITLRSLPSRRVRELNDEIEETLRNGSNPTHALSAQSDLALPRYDSIVNVSHGMFSAWLTGRLDPASHEGGALNAAGEWLYGGDWLTFFVAMAGIRRESRFNIVDLYRACARAGPPPRDAHAHVCCAEQLAFDLPDGPFAVVAPGANEAHRQFNAAAAVDVFSRLHNMGLKIVLAGSQADQPFIASLTAAAPVPVTDLAGRTTVQELAGILRRAEIVLTADSGPAHLAAALERPLVALYGASLAPFTTAPWGEGHVILLADTMDRFSSSVVTAAVRARLGTLSTEEFRREAVAAGVEAWQTVMLPASADPLGGVSCLPLHSDRLEDREVLRRISRHAMASTIAEKDLGDLTYLAPFAPRGVPPDMGAIGEAEAQLTRLASEVARGLVSLRRRRLGGLQELAGRIVAAIERLREAAGDDPLMAPPILFLDWKLRMMPAYEIERIFRENERELKRAARALRMSRQALLRRSAR